jgi:Flp pilus assembly protein TadD
VLAESLLLLGRREEAEPHIRRVLERKPSDPRGRFDAGLLAVASEDWEAARGHLLKCLDSPYTRQKCRVQLAAVCRRLGDLTRADEFQAEADRMPADADWADPVLDECFRRAVKKRSAFRVAENLESQGRFAEAARVLLPVVEDYPDDDVAQSFVGKLFAQLGDLTSAERALRRARQLAPQKVQPHYLLSLVLIQEGQRRKQGGDKVRAEALFREAASLAREALAIKPDYGFAHMALGLALSDLGQKAEARAALETAVRCNPEYAEMHLNLAEVLDELKSVNEARDRYQQALVLAPPGTPWRTRVEARLAELKAPPKPPGK